MMEQQYFVYGHEATDYLKAKDKRLAEAIDRIGMIRRAVIPDLFSALVHSIIGQQISTKAHETLWARFIDRMGYPLIPSQIDAMSEAEIQQFGTTFRKAGYIKNMAHKVVTKELDIEALNDMDDEQVCEKLSELDGIGRWTAEMIMIFSMQRPDVVSYGDLAIRRGMCMLYHHRKLDTAKFLRYRRRYSPYGSVASLYLWAIAGGQLEQRL